MPLVRCPSCGEDEDLHVSDEAAGTSTRLRCGACGETWDKDSRPRCRLCGSDDLEHVPTQTLEAAGRGEQRTPDGIRDAWRCWSCGGRDVTSNHPQPAPDGWRDAAREEARNLRPRRR